MTKHGENSLRILIKIAKLMTSRISRTTGEKNEGKTKRSLPNDHAR